MLRSPSAKNASTVMGTRRHRYKKQQSRPRYTRLALYTFLLSTLLSLIFLHETPPKTLLQSQYTIPSSRITQSQRRFLTYNTHNFTLDGEPIRIVSGSIHYFRAPPSSWRIILLAARAAGLNAIETYIPWNLHEPVKGLFRWSGILDLRAFLETAHEVGLLVLLRPGPFICSEWDFGGLPAYLLADPEMRVRSTYPPFTRAAARYFDAVYEQIVPYIGRPIVAIQLENEYDAFGDEKAYMEFVEAAWVRRGIGRRQLMFFTSDNGGPAVVSKGSPFDSAHVLKTVNFDWNPAVKFGMLRSLQPNAPAMVAEFWSGWFDHWGEKHHTRDGLEIATDVREILFQLDGNINLYMFFGGTNFGFMSGANIGENMTYLADTTSYDYDAFVNEMAELRVEKYEPLRELLKEFWTMQGDTARLEAMEVHVPEQPLRSAYSGSIPLSESVRLFDVLDIVADIRAYSKHLQSMEEVGGDYGYVLYRHNLTESSTTRELHISGVRDHAHVLIDGAVMKMIDRNEQFENGALKTVYIPAHSKQLDVLVENRGRVNYGPYVHDRKGILGTVAIDGNAVEGYEIVTMSFRTDHPLLPDVEGKDVLDDLRERLIGHDEHPPLGVSRSPPTFFRGTLVINRGAKEGYGGVLPGTSIRIYGRGVLWVNGFNCGRFDTASRGPQKSLFVPGALLEEGLNEFVVLHTRMGLVRKASIQFIVERDTLRGRT